jgi:UDP-N-acetylmuramoylalanine--D-glutamate ligase
MIDLSPLKPALKEKPVAILGLGVSGTHSFLACKAAGIATVVWDDNPAAVEEALKKGAVAEDLVRADFSRFSYLCMAPGISPAHPVVIAAKKAGVPVVCDMELFHLAHPGFKTIGITGTNGKSTTTALIGHILKSAGVPSAVGGNIGAAALSLPQLPEGAAYVFELSSYQLDLCDNFAPGIALLINISPDHLERHGTMEGYIAAKKRIFRGPGVAVVGIDDEWSKDVYGEVANSARDAIPVSCLHPLIEGVCVSESGILKDNGRDVCDLKTCRTLQGRHNWQNAAMAYAACHAAGVATEKIIAALLTFPGLAHRQNIVAVQNGVSYINDSKATNDQAAGVALATFNPVYWIAGGKSKGSGYAECENHLAHVRHAFLIGAAEEEMARWLTAQKIPFTKCGTLEKAALAAHLTAQEERLANAAVLFSPACASFDQFRNFEHRGEVFVRLVQGLMQQDAKGATA